MIVYPVLSWETAQQAPNPDMAWANRPKGKETQPLFKRYADGQLKINMDNYCIRIEYETLRSKMGYDLGHPLPMQVKRAWELRMFQKYDPVGFAGWQAGRNGA